MDRFSQDEIITILVEMRDSAGKFRGLIGFLGDEIHPVSARIFTDAIAVRENIIRKIEREFPALAADDDPEPMTAAVPPAMPPWNLLRSITLRDPE